MKTSFEPLPKEARLTAISARIAPVPRRPVRLARPRICGVLFLWMSAPPLDRAAAGLAQV